MAIVTFNRCDYDQRIAPVTRQLALFTRSRGHGMQCLSDNLSHVTRVVLRNARVSSFDCILSSIYLSTICDGGYYVSDCSILGTARPAWLCGAGSM